MYPVYMLVYPIVMDFSSCCVVCDCILSHLCASVSIAMAHSSCSVLCVCVL
jgi:hypothetical protein